MSSRTASFAPPRASVSLALGSAVFTVGLTAFGSFALPVGVAGLVSLAVGIRRSSRTLIHAGGGSLLVGVLLAGIGGVPPLPTLLAGVFAAFAWDASTDTCVCTEYDTDGRTALGRTAGVGLGVSAAAVFCYATYRLATAGRPTVALLALVVGGLTLVAALSETGRR